jgi:hypothetical protein
VEGIAVVTLRVKVAAAACAEALVGLAGSQVMAARQTATAEPPLHLGEGAAVANRMVSDPAIQIRQATPQYYVTSYAAPDDSQPEPWDILSTTNGAVARTTPRTDKPPTLLGKYQVTPAAAQVAFRDLTTDTTTQVTIPSGTT